MKYRYLILSLALSLVATISVNATVGQWQTYFSYTDVQNITQSPNKVFAVSSGAMFSLDKRDLSLEIYSKITGLSDNNILSVNYSDNNQTLFIVYENSNIDLITSNGIFNMPDLYKKQISGSKKVNDIYFTGDFAYLSTDFGICKVNLKKREISDTYIIGENGSNVIVNTTAIWNDSIYACVGKKLLAANINSNVSDFQNWHTVQVPDTFVNQKIIPFDDHLFLHNSDKKVYVRENQQNSDWMLWAENIVSIGLAQGRLNLTKENEIISYSSISNSEKVTTSFSCAKGIYDINNAQFYIAAKNNGLSKGNQDNFQFYTPNGPAYNDPFIMKFAHGKLYVQTSGNVTSGTWNSFIPGAIMIYDGLSWNNITTHNIPAEHGPFYAVQSFVVDPEDPSHFFVGTFQRGLYEFNNYAFTMRHYHANSPIEGNGGDADQIVDGLVYDKKGNLWMTQSSPSVNAIKVFKKDRTWETFYFQNFSKLWTIQGSIIDENGSMWINVPRPTNQRGFFVFNSNGTIENKTDDKYVYMNKSPNLIIDQDGYSFDADIKCFAEDKTEKIWIGTSKGPIIVSNPKTIFNSNFYVTRIKIPRNDGTNLADYLLENEVVNAIAVDGANRKWLATSSSGVYLVSENGTETIYHFTAANSPLLSDNVTSVAVHPETGEVFFGTVQGIISFMGNATEGNKSFSNAYAYPNPVREDFEGVISIVGLMDKTNVKITDIAGNLVYETTSNGGMATWDGTNISGQRVSTGIYLALCSDPEASEVSVVKILIINK